MASVDYRLAPDHPHPAALDGCHAALCWLAEATGVDPTRIAVGGASAGGGLAAALAQRVHDDAGIKLVRQLLVYPMLDDRPPGQEHRHAASFRLWKYKQQPIRVEFIPGPGRPWRGGTVSGGAAARATAR